MTTSKPFTPTRDSARVTPAARAAGANQNLQQVGARVTSTTYRKLKARAALQGATVQVLVEQAIVEFLQNHEE